MTRSHAPWMWLVVAVLAITTACDDDDADERPSAGAPGAADSRSDDSSEDSAFRHRRSALVAASGAPHHVLLDAIGVTGSAIPLRAKINYGPTFQDLEDEQVEATLVVGGEEVTLGSAITNDDGWAEITVGADRELAEGRYRCRVRVLGDDSSAQGWLYVMSESAEVAVFDIDGTLTIGDGEVFEETVLGEEAQMRDGAVEVVEHHVAAGRQPVFVTGRPYLLADSTRAWLDARGFPAGPLFTTRSVSSVAPTASGVQAFKTALLRELQGERGLSISHVYGNALTDVCAYAAVGIAPERTFIIGPHGGASCEDSPASQAVESYPAHLEQLRD